MERSDYLARRNKANVNWPEWRVWRVWMAAPKERKARAIGPRYSCRINFALQIGWVTLRSRLWGRCTGICGNSK